MVVSSDTDRIYHVPTQRNLLFRGLMLGATVVLLFALVVLCAYAFNLMTFPYDYDQGEGFELVDTIQFSQFHWPYQNTDSYPFYSSNYPPLYHVLLAPFVWIFGEAYWYGRLLSWLATLITSATIAYAVQREGGNRWIAALSGLAFLSSNTIYHIAPLLRQHITMVMFETLAVVILAHPVPKRQTRYIVLGLLLLIAAGYTKQLAAITAVAVLVWMILRNPRQGILWSVGFTLTGSLIFAWMTIDTNGEWWRQAIVANVNAFDPFQTFGLTILWWQLHALLIIPAILFVLYETYFDRISLYSTWFIAATVFGAIGSGTWGAGDSYFATSIAALCILSGLFFSHTVHQGWTFRENYLKRAFSSLGATQLQALSKIAIWLIPLLYLGYGLATFKMPTEGTLFGTIAKTLHIQANVLGRHYDSASYDVPGYANIGHFVTQADRVAGDYITEQIRQTAAPVLSEEAGFNLAAGREVISNPTQLRNLWQVGLWDGNALLTMLEQREFGLIVLRAQFYPVPVLEVMGQHYHVTETVKMNGFEYWLLRPME